MREFDYRKLSNMQWDNEILSLIGQIHECKGRQELYLRQKPEQLDRLIQIAKIQSTESSNAIEGIVTTTSRIRQLISEKTTPKNRDEKEIAGYRDALAVIHESYEYIPLKSSYILQLHRILYGHMGRTYGGHFKGQPNYIKAVHPDGHEELLFTPLSPLETPDAIDAICASFNDAIERQETDALIVICVFIKDFLCIHPFTDGNGRMSRLLTTLLLYRCGYVIGKYISLEKLIADQKELYYEALQESSEHWHEGENDNTPFIRYLLGTVLAAYRTFEDRLILVDDGLSARGLVLRAVKDQIGRFTKSDIAEYCPTLSNTSVEKALKQLCEDGTIYKHAAGRSTFYTRELTSPVA